MASPDRAWADDLMLHDRLKSKPKLFHFFAAMRIIEAAHPNNPRLGEAKRPRDEAVRFEQEPDLAFPPTTVADYIPPGEDFARDEAEGAAEGMPGTAQTSRPKPFGQVRTRWTLVNRFFGFFGPQGPLPLHLTEYARNRTRFERDRTFADFANMFSHRFTMLLYRAWTRGRPTAANNGRDADTFTSQVRALGGLATHGLQDRDAMPDQMKLAFTGLLSARPGNASALGTLLTRIAGAPVKIREFSGIWLHMEPEDCWRIGQSGGLGTTTVIGSAVWSRSAMFGLEIGPLRLNAYRRLQPGSIVMQQIAAAIRNYIPDPLDWEVKLILDGRDVPACQLGAGARLGQESWIGTRDPGSHAEDLKFSADAAAGSKGPMQGESHHV